MGNLNKTFFQKIMQNQAPCAFDIQIEKAPAAAAPEIKKRLEATRESKTQLTREQIDKKLKQAADARAAVIEKQKHAATEACVKVQLTRERRTSTERASEEKAAKELDSKLQLAEKKQKDHVSRISDKAREHNERVNKRIEQTQKKQEADAEAMKLELDEKLKKASEKHQAQLQTVK